MIGAAMAEFINLILAAALFISIPATLAIVSSAAWQAFLICLILVALFLIYRRDQRRKLVLELSIRDSIDQRVAELSEMAKSDDFSFSVSNSSFLFSQILSGAIGALLIAAWLSKSNLAFLMLGILLLGFSALLIYRHFSTLGKPLLTATRQGISFGNGTSISWSKITGITLHDTSARTYSPMHTLVFHTACKAPSKRPNLLVRLLRRMGLKPRENIALVLKLNDQHPEVIYRVCRLLWKNQRSTHRSDYSAPPITIDWNFS